MMDGISDSKCHEMISALSHLEFTIGYFLETDDTLSGRDFLTVTRGSKEVYEVYSIACLFKNELITKRTLLVNTLMVL